jgi:hypothetical protein
MCFSSSDNSGSTKTALIALMQIGSKPPKGGTTLAFESREGPLKVRHRTKVVCYSHIRQHPTEVDVGVCTEDCTNTLNALVEATTVECTPHIEADIA